MGMFDYYRPLTVRECPVCGRVLSEWQGKDGPNGLLLWVEGHAAPTDQMIDDDEVRLDVASRDKLRLPPTFGIYSYDCPDHWRIEADCRTVSGVWMETRLRAWSKPG